MSLDVVIPVYNEGRSIVRVLDALARHVRTELRVLIVYDHDDDDTIPAAREAKVPFAVTPLKNEGRGPHGAVTTGFRSTAAPYVLVWPADDDYNIERIDAMVERARAGCDIVCASRLMPGGRMVGAPFLKSAIIRLSALILRIATRLPTHDPSSGLRLFSQRILRTVQLESDTGFTYSIELLVKCHRLGWPICEIPFEWRERTTGRSRFRVLVWLPAYFVWFRYALATTYLRRGAASVKLRERS